MDISSLFEVSNAITLVLFCAVFWIVRVSQQPPPGFPPGRTGIPFVGAIFSVGSHFERTVASWKTKYGPVCSIKVGSRRIVILNTYEAIHEAFVNKGQQLSGRWQPTIMKETNNCDNGLAMLDYSEKWKTQRKFALSTLAFFGLGKRSIEPGILTEVDSLCEVLTEKETELGKKGFHPGSYFGITALNIINTLSYGKICKPKISWVY